MPEQCPAPLLYYAPDQLKKLQLVDADMQHCEA